MRLQSIEMKLQATQNQLFNLQGQVASGMTIEVYVKSDLVKFVIGKEGSHIKKVCIQLTYLSIPESLNHYLAFILVD